ncbi:hypothetical protein OG455_15590 [Kitasatospora sp. NBC_01287]|uniref:hypothetical protein n=1 Tax=Kitasatospora sp. NBC_01287 TaxID=2903573 RepID=UPI0022525BCC|nr:hypothetical protein [Kitasatospora sp. NBC_01287]MCX4746929.1 hypothetical protein [Kitasatospora sp. NBC_01287]
MQGKTLLATTESAADRVIVVSLMKSGTHLVQELMVALGYGIYGQSRIPAEIRPVFDAETRRDITGAVLGAAEAERLAAGDPAAYDKAVAKAWDAYGWSWQLRFGLPLVNRYGMAKVNEELVERAVRRTAATGFADTPAGVCWVLPELDIKKLDGAFLTEWTQQGEPRIVFMYRDPRDVVLSMVNFLSGKTAQGYGNFSEFQVFNRILTSKASLEEKLEYALTDPSFPGAGDFERSLWLLNHPNVCKVSFEELVGAKGGGSDEMQQQAVARVCEFLGFDSSHPDLGGNLFRRDSFSFFKGQIGSWRESFTPRLEPLVESRLAEVINRYGYK